MNWFGEDLSKHIKLILRCQHVPIVKEDGCGSISLMKTHLPLLSLKHSGCCGRTPIRPAVEGLAFGHKK